MRRGLHADAGAPRTRSAFVRPENGRVAARRRRVNPLLAAWLARGLPPRRDDPPRVAQVTFERVIRDLVEQDADPPSGADIPRVEIGIGRFFDHQRLLAV